MTDVQRSCRVGRDELHLDLLSLAHQIAPEGITAVEHLADHLGGGVGGGEEVDETGAGDLDLADGLAGGRAATSFSASSRGFRPAGLASINARLVA